MSTPGKRAEKSVYASGDIIKRKDGKESKRARNRKRPEPGARPQTQGGGSFVTTPGASTMIALLGSGYLHEGVAISRDEYQALNKVYGFKPEKPNKRPPKPVQPPYKGKTSWDREPEDREHQSRVEKWERWEDPQAYMQAGADRNMIRHAEHDGLRLVAWLAKYVPEGEDPLKTVIQMAINSGFDVDPDDVSYAEDRP